MSPVQPECERRDISWLTKLLDERFAASDKIHEAHDKLDDARFTALEKKIEAQFVAASEVRMVAEKHLELWKHQTNQFREQILEERVHFFPKVLGWLALVLTIVNTILALYLTRA